MIIASPSKGEIKHGIICSVIPWMVEYMHFIMIEGCHPFWEEKLIFENKAHGF